MFSQLNAASPEFVIVIDQNRVSGLINVLSLLVKALIFKECSSCYLWHLIKVQSYLNNQCVVKDKSQSRKLQYAKHNMHKHIGTKHLDIFASHEKFRKLVGFFSFYKAMWKHSVPSKWFYSNCLIHYAKTMKQFPIQSPAHRLSVVKYLNFRLEMCSFG